LTVLPDFIAVNAPLISIGASLSAAIDVAYPPE
jgi:hypothetical protein